MKRTISLWLLLMIVSCWQVSSLPIRPGTKDDRLKRASVNLPRLFRSRRFLTSHEHDRGEHLLQRITDQIHDGHVSAEKINHWQTELMHGMQEGILTQDQVQAFLHQTLSSVQVTDHHHESSPFWLG